MNHRKSVGQQRVRRRFRVRKKLRGNQERPRLTVSRTLKHIYCQVINDFDGKTIASASTLDKDLRGEIKNGGNQEAAKLIGKAIAERALAAGVKAVCLDRGSCKYLGRVAALTDAVREAGVSV
ncbi:MAG: 50S ribosomal protein L18 [Pirellulaceae bacterium]|nr:50S ribosomal protein L18 [Pirellulaceae bacterium]